MGVATFESVVWLPSDMRRHFWRAADWLRHAGASARGGLVGLNRPIPDADLARFVSTVNDGPVRLGTEVIEAGCLLLACQQQGEGQAGLQVVHLRHEAVCEDGQRRPVGWNRQWRPEAGRFMPAVPRVYQASSFAELARLGGLPAA